MTHKLEIHAEPRFTGNIYTIITNDAARRRRRQNAIVLVWMTMLVGVPFDVALLNYWAGLGVGMAMLVLTIVAMTGRLNKVAVKLKLTSMILNATVDDYVLESYLDTVALRAKWVGEGCSLATFIIERTKDDNRKPVKDETRRASCIYHLADMDTLNEIIVLCRNQIANLDTVDALDNRIESNRGAPKD